MPLQFIENGRLTDQATGLVQIMANFMDDVIGSNDSDWIPVVFSELSEVAMTTFKTDVDPIVRSLHSRQATLV